MRKNANRICACLLAITILVVMLLASGVLPVYAAESGKCGAELSWSYSLGTLTITGKGSMSDFNEFDTAPWYHLREDIKKVVLPEGITSLGMLSFWNCTNLKTVSIPNSVRRIGNYAFRGCESLQFVSFPSNLTSVGTSAFHGCKKLNFVDLPISLEKIADKAFYLCESLTSVVIPKNVTSIGTQAFAYCTDLVRVKVEARIKVLPEWVFYGCSSLSEIELPETLSSVEQYAFKNCEELTNVYHSGSTENVKSVKESIVEDIPGFENGGYVGTGVLTSTSYSSSVEEDADGKLVSQTNTTVKVQDDITLVTVVTVNNSQDSTKKYTSSLVLSVEGEDAWSDASQAVTQSLRDINDSYSSGGQSNGCKLTVYMNDTSSVDESFLKSVAGRDMKVEIVTPVGDTWRVNCSDVKEEEVTGNVNYSYSVDSASKESKKELGTNDCYKVSFSESTELKTEILVQLPAESVNTNAFLYQVENDGTHTRLQAVAVDNDGNAHFYLASVDKDTEYVVGLNVPGERTDDVIIPDELSEVYGAIARLEKIEYVSTGVRSINGMTIGDITIIVIIVLTVTMITVGVVMFIMNKRKLQKMYGETQAAT